MIDCAGHFGARCIVNGVDQKAVFAKSICQTFRMRGLREPHAAKLWRYQQP
jgi:hypothetical protein